MEMKMNIHNLLLSRIMLALFTLLAVSALIFMGTELLPGDVASAILGQSATPEALANIRQDLGLNRPVTTRYLEWLFNFISGDMGKSIANGSEISAVLPSKFANTMFLALYAAAIAVPLSLLLGLISAIKQGTWIDKTTSIISLFSISLPEFLVGYILVYIFSVSLGWLPSMAILSDDITLGEKLYILALPVVTLVITVLAHMTRMTRIAVINILSQPYIEMAYLNGIPRNRVVLLHALPNAIAPIANVIALNLAYLIAGVVVVEVVFVYAGMGQLMIDSVSKRDLPMVQACAMVFAVVYIILNLIADLFAILSNPRILHPK